MLTKVANFLNLLDIEGRLSITNVSLLIVLGKLVFIPEPSLPEICAFIATLANYSHKRMINNDNSKLNDNNSQKEESK